MAERKTKVRILETRSVVLDGKAVEAGEVAEVTSTDAKTLIAEGYAERA